MLTITPKAMDGAKNVRRAIVLFTDGVDTASEMKPEDAVKVLEGLADPLYVLGIEPPPADEGPEDCYEQLLASFATASGGRYLRVDTAARLPEFAQELRHELTMRYIIDFQPSGSRDVEVAADRGARRRQLRGGGAAGVHRHVAIGVGGEQHRKRCATGGRKGRRLLTIASRRCDISRVTQRGRRAKAHNSNREKGGRA